MATPKALEALQKTEEALAGIKSKLEPVLAKLQDDSLERGTRAQGHATVALSLGMMKYMGARLRGLDQGRKPDDPLRQELNNMRKVLAELKEKYKEKEGSSSGSPSKATTPASTEPAKKTPKSSSKTQAKDPDSGKKRKAGGGGSSNKKSSSASKRQRSKK